MLTPAIQKNDKKAKLLIGIVSVVVLVAVIFLSKYTLKLELPFDKHIFALMSAVINSAVALTLLAALVKIKQKKYQAHKNLMLLALSLSVLFLVTYIAHHLLAGEAKFGDSDFDGIVTEAEKAVVGNTRPLYFLLLITHIILAATSLPFILFTAYRGLTGEYEDHKRKARVMWPIWFYVAVTGPLVYMMIKPYYN